MAIALVVVILNPALITALPGVSGTMTGWSVLGISVSTTAMQLGLGLIAVSLAMQGIMQMMAPDPAVDQAMPETYLFNGPEQNVVQGDPVPVLYGRLRVPGQPVNFEIAGTGVRKITHSFNEDGSSYSTENSSEREEQ